ncbi:transglutaminase family protein [Pseudenhygromyxa sp. WMMC2535]|uniref:transglutaminase-like domain-containing protein n=1 Tax=Pseudenhygromyxa sp. WMMC2535 TaxID=2712867 RepID=UPI0015576415|nr:transglutaminase family protein [Pseudenhygromyxa sp. WMMC2535]NVB38266.1 transglutaminase family protein [Pseudenhygromyxa sp. WMMC2535]
MTENAWLAPTPIADFDHPSLATLVESRGWRQLSTYDKIGAAYAFVKDEIAFGYNRSDDLPASEVLRDGYGQCNTKGNLLLALLRSLGVPARFHGFTIDKALQRGAIPEWLFPLSPSRILHSWVEVQHGGEWLELEGFILDEAYLSAVQRRFPERTRFCGFGAATPDLRRPQVEWRGRSTYIQREGIADDFGVFTSPDAFYEARGTNLVGPRRWLFEHVARHVMNRRVRRIRQAGPRPATALTAGPSIAREPAPRPRP